MSVLAFLKDRRGSIVAQLLAVGAVAAAAAVLSGNPAFVVLLIAIMLTGIVAALVIDYLPRRAYYGGLLATVDALERKNLMAEVAADPRFGEGRIVHEILRSANKAMLEEISTYREREKEYREYIELWVHEIKTPIASAKLLARNNPSASTDAMLAEIERVEDLVEQTLFHARSNSVDRDFLVRETSLVAVVNPAVRRNARTFIERRILLDMGDLDFAVLTDVKWAAFIVHQVLANALAYTPDRGAEIGIHARRAGQSVLLIISDNGCGIPCEELPRVFDKGFTGSSGRRKVASTGLGLYLVRKLADRLGVGVSIESIVDEGTEVTLIFSVLS